MAVQGEPGEHHLSAHQSDLTPGIINISLQRRLAESKELVQICVVPLHHCNVNKLNADIIILHCSHPTYTLCEPFNICLTKLVHNEIITDLGRKAKNEIQDQKAINKNTLLTASCSRENDL